MAEDFSAWSTEDLLEEIRREEDILTGFRDQLEEARTRRAEVETAIAEEKLVDYEERYRTRARRITEIEATLPHYEREIATAEEKVLSRAETVRSLEESIARLETRLTWAWISPVERLITREQIAVLRRSLRAQRGHLTRETEILEAWRSPYAWMKRRLTGYREWQRKEEPYARRLSELREDLRKWRSAIRDLGRTIRREEARLQRKRDELKKRKRLCRVKIRLYAVKQRGRYYLTFQGFFDVDAIIKPETGLPDWDWWLTKMEIEYARYHFHGYWKGGVKRPKPFAIDEIQQAYLTDTGGIALPEYMEKKPAFGYTRDVPEEYKRLAGRMTLEEIIIGLSNIKPRPVPLPEGVFFEYAMIIDEEGDIKWMEKRDRWVWKPTAEIIDRVRKELGLR